MIEWIRRWTAAVACAVYWGLGAAVFFVMALIAVPLLPEKTSRRMGRWLLQAAFSGFERLLWVFRIAECERVGFEKLDQYQGGGFIVAPNHPAIWDVVFILARLGGLTCIIKATLLRNPLMVGGAKLSRFIANDPPHEMVKRCVKALSGGEHLLLFPEGTRTRKKETVINEFRGGIAIVARHARVPVFPVIVETNDDFGAKGEPPWRPPEKTVRIRMTVCDPLTCGPDESAHAFLERLRARYIEALSGPNSTR